MSLTRFMFAAIAFAVPLAGCSGGRSSGGSPGQDGDIAQYTALAESLDASRTVFDKTGGQDLTTTGNLLFWVDASAGDNPVLHSFDSSSKQATIYDFPVFQPLGDGTNTDKTNFSASAHVVASMNHPDAASVYEVGAARSLMGKLTVPAPPNGAKWWPYAVSGKDLYVALRKPDDPKYTLQKWSAGSASPQDVLVIDDLIAPNRLTELVGFAVDGGTLVFDDNGRFWMASLTGGKARWVKNSQEIGGLSHDDDGVIYNEGLELWKYDLATDTRENLSDRIRKNPYRMNETFKESHFPSQGGLSFCRSGTKIVYVGNSGLYSYDYKADVVKPLLLEPRGGSTTVRYIHPVATEDGTIFVTGLESKSGSTGASGPIYTLAGS